MSPDRWPAVERLYEQAIALPVDQRVAFLGRACGGDDGLRLEVQSLLSLESVAAEFLEQPALRAAATTLSHALPHLKQPDVPGYRIIRELGEGGMGVVYLAEQHAPLQRVVALKLIRPGMDSRQVLARFERERQALARMDHPNIAAVFDAGSTADGRPYFVMEFVDGVSITEYCDSHQLSVRARLSLFIQVCHAVQHAHQKGVIHRDIKPSNVLVIEQDGQPLPKVIDFGTAKSADRNSEGTTLTTDGLVFGTVEYMSPEQAAFSSDIDTTTDVYSLGILLYELLVGCTPFNRQKAETNTLDTMLTAVRDSDPPRPSVLISRDKTLLASAGTRFTDVAVLTKELSRDLDWIVLKALEKDRRRRYQTAASLGADVQRFQDSKPIEARSPSMAYRVRKFTRRYRGGVAATAAVIITLILGLVTTTIFYVRAEQSAKEAGVQGSRATAERDAADAARKDAVAQTAEAERFRQEAERQTQTVSVFAESLRGAYSEQAYSNYAATVVAAHTEVASLKLASARERLLKIPESFRNWEWWFLFNQTDDSVFRAVSETPSCLIDAPLVMSADIPSQALSVDAASSAIVFRRCAVVEIWSPSGARIGRFQAPATREPVVMEAVLAVDPASKAMVVVSQHQTFPLWSVRVFYPATRNVVDVGRFSFRPGCADLSRDGQHVVLGLRNLRLPGHAFEVWKIGGTRESQLPAPVELPNPGLNVAPGFMVACHVKFSPDGSQVASSGTTVDLWSWSAATARPYFTDAKRPGAYPQPLAFSPSGDKLAIGRSNGSIDVIQLADPAAPPLTLSDGQPEGPANVPVGLQPLRDFLARSRAVVALAFSPDGYTLASGAGKTVTVWDLWQRKNRQAGQQQDVNGIAISADGRFVYSSDVGGQLHGWPVQLHLAVTQSSLQSPLQFPSMGSMLVADKANLVVGPGLNGGLAVLRLPDLQQTELLPGESLWPLALSHDGTRVYVTDTRGRLRVLSLTDGRTLASRMLEFEDRACNPNSGLTRGVSQNPITNMALSYDDRYLAFYGAGCVDVWDANSLGRVATIDHGQTAISNVMFRRDGLLIVTMRAFGQERPSSVEILDWRTRKPAQTITLHADGPSQDVSWGLTQSADGKRIGLLSYATGLPATLLIMDPELKNEFGRMAVGDSVSAALNADGSRAVTVSLENPALQIWDTTRSSVLLTLPDSEGHMFGVKFTHAGRIVAGRSSGGITVWDPRFPSLPISR